jgi:iron complex outermembrane receptor protein
MPVIGCTLIIALISGTPAVSRGPVATLEDVIVVGSAAEGDFRTGDVDTETTPAFVTVIPRESFEGRFESLGGLLEKEVGVQIRSSGGLGSFSTVSLRGATSDQVMIFLDGVLLNDASGGGVDLSNISLSDVEAIEIYRGVTPVNFGKASVGGVVHIRTLRAKEGFKGSFGAGYGSFDARKGFALVRNKTGKGDYIISADYLGSANDFKILNTRGTDWNKSDDRVERRHNAGFDQYNLLVKAGRDFSRDVRVDVTHQYFQKKQGLPSWINLETARTSLDTSRNITTLRLAADDLGGNGVNLALQASHLLKDEKYDDSLGHAGLGRQQNEYRTERWSGSSFAEWITRFHIVSMNIEYQRETFRPSDLLFGRTLAGGTRDYLSTALQDTILLLGDRLAISPVVRFVWLKDEMENGQTASGGSFGGSGRRDGYLMPQAGVKYKLLDWLALKSNIASHVREPSFYELFGDRGFFIGNEDLKAEKGTNFDAGFEVNRALKSRWINGVRFSCAYFSSSVDDLITRVYDARGVGRAVNISKSEIRGIETSYAADLLGHFTISANYTWQDPKNTSPIPAFDGKRLPGRYDRSLTGKLEARYLGWKAFIEYLYESGLFYDTANLVEAPDKSELNAGVSFTFRGMTLELEGKNLEDRLHEDFNRYPLPGRSFYTTLRYDF